MISNGTTRDVTLIVTDYTRVSNWTVNGGTLSRTFFIVVAALTLCVCAAVLAFPSVLAVSLEQLSTASQLIFEGEVVGKTSEFNANQTSIHTYVTFRVVDVVKGTYNQPEITLRFLGGTVGEIGLNVSDSTLPELGETGIYFVESLERFRSIHSTAWIKGTFWSSNPMANASWSLGIDE